MAYINGEEILFSSTVNYSGGGGEAGLSALVFNETLTQDKDPAVNDNMSAELQYFNRTPVTDDTFHVTFVNTETNISFLVQGKITNVGDAIADYMIINVNRLTGEQGIQGEIGATFEISGTTLIITTGA